MQQIAARNKSESAIEGTPFHSPFTPSVSLDKYMERLVQYMHCSLECFVIASLLLTRLEESYANATIITPATMHRLMLATAVVAAKTQEDVFLDNRYYSEVGGVTLDEMNRLETFLLDRLQFRVFVSPEQYSVCLASLSSLYDTSVVPPCDEASFERRRTSSIGNKRSRTVSVADSLLDLEIESEFDGARKRQMSILSQASDMFEEFYSPRDRTESLVDAH